VRNIAIMHRLTADRTTRSRSPFGWRPEVNSNDAHIGDVSPSCGEFSGTIFDERPDLIERQISASAVLPVLLATIHPEDVDAISRIMCMKVLTHQLRLQPGQ
jgi:hypothetical protein